MNANCAQAAIQGGAVFTARNSLHTAENGARKLQGFLDTHPAGASLLIAVRAGYRITGKTLYRTARSFSPPGCRFIDCLLLANTCPGTGSPNVGDRCCPNAQPRIARKHESAGNWQAPTSVAIDPGTRCKTQPEHIHTAYQQPCIEPIPPSPTPPMVCANGAPATECLQIVLPSKSSKQCCHYGWALTAP